MTQSSEHEKTSIGQALGRIPSGLFLLTVRRGPDETGMLASWVQQAGFDPPMVTVAVRSDRFVAGWIAETGRFTLNAIPTSGKALLKHFGKGFEPGEPAFSGVSLRDQEAFGPVLSQAMAYLDVEVVGHVEGGDHRIYLARIVAGALFDAEAEPMVHIRKNGFHY